MKVNSNLFDYQREMLTYLKANHATMSKSDIEKVIDDALQCTEVYEDFSCNYLPNLFCNPEELHKENQPIPPFLPKKSEYNIGK